MFRLEKWYKLEEIICANASQSLSSCDYSLAVRNSFAAKSDLFLIENFREFFRQMRETEYANNVKQSDGLLQVLLFKVIAQKRDNLMSTS